MISDQEIALIKAMMARGMKIVDIQFFFNRPNRPVNSGRFADIREGRYRNSSKIIAASEEELQKYIKSHAISPLNLSINDSDPIAPDVLKALFEPFGRGKWRLRGSETDRVECKENFHLRGKWMRAFAAFANNRGGYIIFGVRDQDSKDGPYVVVGMRDDAFSKIDPTVITAKVRSYFDPTPEFQITSINFGKKKVGIIFVDKHPARPVIVTKQEGDLAEGDIYFRYPGQSIKIKYSDLRTLLDERDARVRAELQPMLDRLIELGPKRAMIADLSKGELSDGRHAIRIDEELVDKIKFIKEGEFVEKRGAPALRLIGDVQPGKSEVAIKKGIVNREEMLADFFDGQSMADPTDYLRFAIEMSNGDWLPIRHFARLAGFDNNRLLAFIDQTSGPLANKNKFKSRVAKPNAAFNKAVGRSAVWLKKLAAGDLVRPSNVKEAGEIGKALQGINDSLDLDFSKLKQIARECLNILNGTSGAAASYIRRGVARIDELIDMQANR